MTELRSRHLFTLQLELHPIQEIGKTPMGVRRVFPVSGGRFEGERLSGVVLPHAGCDHLLGRADGSFQQDVRLTLQDDGGDLILMTYRGVRRSSPEVAERLARGETVAASDYYLRTAPFFETGSERLAWLNGIVTVAMGERAPGGVTYELFEIL
jgi:hypothetical protein